MQNSNFFIFKDNPIVHWSPLRALSACGQILHKNPGKGQTPPHSGNAWILGVSGPYTPPLVWRKSLNAEEKWWRGWGAPIMVMMIYTLPASPPKAAMLSCTHCKAADWSQSPALPGASSIPSVRKPDGPTLPLRNWSFFCAQEWNIFTDHFVTTYRRWRSYL